MYCVLLRTVGKVHLYSVSFHSNHYHSYSVVREKRGNIIYLTCVLFHIEISGESPKVLHNCFLSVSMVTPVHPIVLSGKGEEYIIHLSVSCNPIAYLLFHKEKGMYSLSSLVTMVIGINFIFENISVISFSSWKFMIFP